MTGEYTTLELVKGVKDKVQCPSYVNSDGINLSENALKVLERRYIRKDEDGNPTETIGGMFYRVANRIASAEEDPQSSVHFTERFYKLLSSLRFLPNSPTFTGAGTPLGQLAACFVLPISDDMGNEPDGIFSTLRVAALIQQTGGGNGFSFSRLRPKNDIIRASSGKATGPVGFLGVYDRAFGEIAQGGTRRGANMAVLRVDHPDIEEFIACKSEEGALTNFNISVAITDGFMRAAMFDADFKLRNPRDGSVVRTVRARELFRNIIKHAHRNGEPGALFIDTANRDNPVPDLYELEATNPCGEQWLGPYENCCLGSINLGLHVNEKGLRVDWEKLRVTIRESTHFLDNVVSVNAYLPAVPAVKDAALQSRRIGLGIMGLGDMMYKIGVGYGTQDGRDFAGQVMEFVRYHCMQMSIELAAERGAFPAFAGSIYHHNEETGMAWVTPETYDDLTDLNRPYLNWGKIVEGILEHGIRNAAQTTVAPTGTLSTVAGCEGYGCEPVFALGYVRHFKDGDKDVELNYTSPLFEQAIEEHYHEEDVESIMEQVTKTGSCQDVEELLHSEIKKIFVVSGDITAEQHVSMQASIQRFVDNSISKTCNFPANATERDVERAYIQAWESGCKGLTVYVTGSRDQVVLETKEVKERKLSGIPAIVEGLGIGIDWEKEEPAIKRPRPHLLHGSSYRKDTPLGTAYVTVNSGDDQEPFEVFVNIGKAGSDVTAVSEAIGRLISLTLRMPSTIPPTERLRWVIDEMAGIGGGRALGFGAGRVRSLPDGVAQVLAEHIGWLGPDDDEKPAWNTIGDLCPECGEASFIHTEGCRKCHVCGYSEC